MAQSIRLYTCLADRNSVPSRSRLEDDWPGFLNDGVGTGRMFILRGGELYIDRSLAKLESWDEVLKFEPPSAEHDNSGPYAAVVSDVSAFPVGRYVKQDDAERIMQEATVIAAQRALTDASHSDHRQQLMSVGSAIVLGVCAVAILVMVIITAAHFVGDRFGEDETQDPHPATVPFQDDRSRPDTESDTEETP